ncbi:SDR family oxidoreductase [Neobacillus niacini]|uniref:SDR family oxidoreductase n=1 Tax=Neobacillus niacini TaxID=86668 RepID=UPI0020402929|nr:NAD(P)H-binding protein [Neobacillus niacini]MCM3694531.1 NAD(P)H-binding protein [Neobacillus niacini]
MKVLVTGATGQLGSALLKQLKNTNYEVTITSRRKPDNLNFDWVYSDFLTGEGLEAAINEMDVIIHTATSPRKDSKIIDVSEFGNFLNMCQHIKHFIYPSIVGIENIPMKYYKHKYQAEELLKNSSVPHTIIRATQFHRFIESLFLSKPFFKKYFVPGNFRFQSVDVVDFANHLIKMIDDGPQGIADDFGGPEILTLREMADLKIKVNNESNNVVSFSFPGKLYKSFLEGKNTNEHKKVGKLTFEEYLRNKGK